MEGRIMVFQRRPCSNLQNLGMSEYVTSRGRCDHTQNPRREVMLDCLGGSHVIQRVLIRGRQEGPCQRR